MTARKKMARKPAKEKKLETFDVWVSLNLGSRPCDIRVPTKEWPASALRFFGYRRAKLTLEMK